jgi:hypothetical protein
MQGNLQPDKRHNGCPGISPSLATRFPLIGLMSGGFEREVARLVTVWTAQVSGGFDHCDISCNAAPYLIDRRCITQSEN